MTTARRATADVLGAALELRRAARDAARGTGGADAVLAALSGLVAHDFASLARWDPLRRRHLTLVGTYPAAATAYIETRLHDDPSFAAVRRSPDGVRWWQDVPEPERHASPGIREVLRPLGVRGGVAQCLFAADGRYVGVLNVSTTRVRAEEDGARAALTLLGECLGALADPLVRPGSTEAAGTAGAAGPAGAGSVGRAADGCAVLVAPDADTAPVPVSGAPLPGLTGAASPLTVLVRRAAARRPLPAVVLVPYQRRLLELRLTRRDRAVLVTCRAVAHPAGLSPRETEVLAELTRGRTNREIAGRLGVGVRTVATHVEHLLAKLGVPNRAAAAGRAAAWCLEPVP